MQNTVVNTYRTPPNVRSLTRTACEVCDNSDCLIKNVLKTLGPKTLEKEKSDIRCKKGQQL